MDELNEEFETMSAPEEPREVVEEEPDVFPERNFEDWVLEELEGMG